METIKAFLEIDYVYTFVSVLTILAGAKLIVSLFEWPIKRLGLETKRMREKREERELLVNTSKNLAELQKKHMEDVKQSIAHDKKIQNELSEFISEVKASLFQTQSELKQFAENRVHDREQSLEIQKELTDSIKNINNNVKERDQQINSLTIANKELLAEKINEKYKYYISINGIPEDEVDEFTSLHIAYNSCGGNHHGDAKYNYVMEHLPVIPVEIKLVYKD